MRTLIVGTSGSGKSTFARHLSTRAGVPHLELDALNWQPGWRSLYHDDQEEYLRRLDQATSGTAWIADGNIGKREDVLLLARATDIVWLDYPRWRVMARIIPRSVWRTLSGREIWPGTGNREEWRFWLRKDHVVRWSWASHERGKRKYEALFADPAYAHIVKHRIGHPRQAAPLLRALAGKA